MLIKIIKHTVCNGKNVSPDDLVEADKPAAKFLKRRGFAKDASAKEIANLAKDKAAKAAEEAKAADEAAEKSAAEEKASEELKAAEEKAESKKSK